MVNISVSVAKTCRVLWYIEKDSHLTNGSWNADILSWYVILRALYSSYGGCLV